MSKTYNRKDRFYTQAKESGYRSRASYKLKEIQDKLKIIKVGHRVLDLGCFPGGWLQVAAELVGESGLVVGIDRVFTEDLPNSNIKIILGDLYESSSREEIQKISPESFDVVLSDMSPSLTGIKDSDDSRSAELLQLASGFAREVLKQSGTFVAKIFPGHDCDLFVKEERKKWGTFQTLSLKSTRGSSIEKYIVGRGL